MKIKHLYLALLSLLALPKMTLAHSKHELQKFFHDWDHFATDPYHLFSFGLMALGLWIVFSPKKTLRYAGVLGTILGILLISFA